VLVRDLAGSLAIGVDHGNELGMRQAGVFLDVEAAKMAEADDGCPNLLCHGVRT